MLCCMCLLRLVCLCYHDNQSIIQEEPPPSVPADCICVVVVFSLPPPLAANGNDSKKFKSEVRSPSVPSRVVHVRKLPNDINEAEVIGLGLPFGKVTNLLMLKGKNQVGNLHECHCSLSVFSCASFRLFCLEPALGLFFEILAFALYVFTTVVHISVSYLKIINVIRVPI